MPDSMDVDQAAQVLDNYFAGSARLPSEAWRAIKEIVYSNSPVIGPGATSHIEIQADDIAAMLTAASHVAKAPRDMPVRRMEAAAFELGDRIAKRTAIRQADADELVEASHVYYSRYCQDEAADEEGRWTGCGVEQHKDAARLRSALAKLGKKPLTRAE